MKKVFISLSSCLVALAGIFLMFGFRSAKAGGGFNSPDIICLNGVKYYYYWSGMHREGNGYQLAPYIDSKTLSFQRCSRSD